MPNNWVPDGGDQRCASRVQVQWPPLVTLGVAHKIIFAITHQIKVQCGIKKDSFLKLMGSKDAN